jgi:cell division protease FtsH
MGHQRDYSEQMAEVIDAEVRTFIEAAHQEAYEILADNRDVLDRLVVELLDRETLDQHEVAEIFSDLRKREHRPVWLSSSQRPVSDRGPVLSRKELSSEVNGSPNGHGATGAPTPAGETAEPGRAE